jgi:hypothetical protein
VSCIALRRPCRYVREHHTACLPVCPVYLLSLLPTCILLGSLSEVRHENEKQSESSISLIIRSLAMELSDRQDGRSSIAKLAKIQGDASQSELTRPITTVLPDFTLHGAREPKTDSLSFSSQQFDQSHQPYPTPTGILVHPPSKLHARRLSNRPAQPVR